MAEKKKVYKIVINGLEESVDLVKSLNKQLDDLNSKIKGIGKQKIVIQGEVQTDTPTEKKKVSGGADVGAEKELAIQKQLTAEIKATAQAQAALTDEYQKSFLETQKQKEAVKEVKTAMNDMLKGAIDEGGNYTNTINGMRAELRNLTTELNKTELGTEEYAKLNDRVSELTNNLKALEGAHGDFRRNVGNYPTAEIEAFRNQFTLLYTQMSDLVKESNDLQRQLAEATPGTEAYDKISERLKQVRDELTKAKDAVNDFNNGLKQLPQGGITINVGGVERQFANAKQAVKELTKEMQQLAVEGKTDTQEFKDLMVTLAQVKTSINQTTQEMQSYIGNAKGLADTVEIMKGLTGLASIGQGLITLFGGTNKELDETLRKFAGLTMVMQGIEQQYKAIQDGQSIWGVSLKKTWNWLDKIGNWKFPFQKKTFTEYAQATSDWNKALQAVAQWRGGTVEDQFVNIRNSMDELTNGFEQFSTTEVKKFTKAMASLQTIKIMLSTNDATEQLDLLNQKIEQTKEQLRELEDAKVQLQMDGDVDGLKDVNKQIDQCKASLDALQQSEVTLRTEGASAAISDLNENVRDFDGVLADLEGKGIEVKGLKDLYSQFKKLTTEGGKLTSTIKTLPKFLQSGGLAARAFAVGINVATTALKGFAKATIILAAVQLLLEGLLWIVEKVGDAFYALKGASELDFDKQLDMISDSTERANSQLDKFIKTQERLRDKGQITALEAENKALDAIGKAAIDAGKELKKFLDIQDEIKAGALGNNLNNSSIWGDRADIKTIDEFKEHYETLERAVELGIDKIEAGWKRGSGAMLTAGDAVEQLGDDTKAILGDMQNEINKINFNDPEQAIKQMRKITDNELYKSAIANMDKLFPEEEWAQALSRMYANFNSMVSRCEDRAEDLGVAVVQANKQLEEQTRQSQINAIADQNKRQEAQDEYDKKRRQDEINATLADEEHKQQALAALDDEYAQKAKDRRKAQNGSRKSSGDELARIERQIRDNILEAQKEGLDKEIQQLKNKQADEIDAAKKSGRKVKEQILAINAKYNILIEKAEKDWYKRRLDTLKSFNDDMLALTAQYQQELQRVDEQANINKINRTTDVNEAVHEANVRALNYDIDITAQKSQKANQDLLKAQKQYHKQLLAENMSYLRDKYSLMEEESMTNQENLLREEERNYNAQAAALDKSNKEKHEQINQYYEQGLIDEEEYTRMIEENQVRHTTAVADLNAAHQTKMSEIKKNGEAERTVLQEQYNQERYNAQEDANDKEIEAIQRMYDEISQIAEREKNKNMNRHTGLFNIAKERERLKQVKDAYETTMKELDAQYEELKRQLNDNEIDFAGFQRGKQEIDALRTKAEQEAKNTQESLDDLFQSWCQSVNDFVSQIGSQMQSMLSVISDIQSMRFDMEEEALDREEANLERESEMIEKAYQKQADIVQAYKDRINDTENNLKNARGERREALIASLEQQKKAYERETEVLKKQELEKEKIAQKEEALKKKQEQLEKKRKQAQQQASLIQAIINTAMGVTQALGAYPPPASYIFAAAVGALGAAQIATIASQKYADGGVIQGKSHAEGGIKVLGGRAEVEGGEYITNKKTTQYNADILSYINGIKRKITPEDMTRFFDNRGKFKIPASHGTKFAQGGQMPELTDFNLKEQINWQPQQEDNKTYVVQVVDIASSLENYETIKTIAGLD